jgi:hypothetical protein
MSDERDEVALAAGLHFQDGETVLLIVKRHPLDRADEGFTRSVRVGCRAQDVFLPRVIPQADDRRPDGRCLDR